MASFTPSNLQINSMGSSKLTIATINGSVISGTDFWSSGVNDIKSIVGQCYGQSTTPVSDTSFTISWTATDGTIHIRKALSSSGTGAILWICSGGPDTKC